MIDGPAAFTRTVPSPPTAGTESDFGISLGLARVAVVSEDLRSDVSREFEAVFLKQFVESMLSKEDGQVFGAGTAGSVWRSMLADGIARELSQSDLLGFRSLFDAPGMDAPGGNVSDGDPSR